MRKSEEIYNDVLEEVTSNGCQSMVSIAKVGISVAQKEMFEYLYSMAEDSDNNERLVEFFDEMEKSLLFDI